MAALATQTITRAGVVPTYASAAGGGDSFTPSSDTFLHVKNGSGGSLTVTVAAPAKVPGTTDLTIASVADAVAAGAERMMGPFPYELFAQSDGTAAITYSGVTSLTVAVLKLSKP